MYIDQYTVNRSLNIRFDLLTVHIVSKGPVLLGLQTIWSLKGKFD